MSLLTACQAVVQETGIGSSPASIIANTDPAAVQLLALAKRAAKTIAKRNWQRMIREQTITTVASQSDYDLPSDWARYIGETMWDASNYWQMKGSLTPEQWQALKRGIVTLVTPRKLFRLRGNKVMVIPTPTASGESLIIEYVRNTPWIDSGGTTYRTAPTDDTDTTVFPEHLLELDLKWRWKHAKGLDYTEDANEADREITLAFAQDVPAMVVDYGRGSFDTPPFTPNVPQSISTS